MKRIEVKIENRDYWIKIVEFLQQNWAIIDQRGDKFVIYFLGDNSGVFDSIEYDNFETAERELRINGFKKYAGDKEIQIFIPKPEPPFYESSHPNGKIYSSGRYWTFIERKNTGSLTAELRIINIKNMPDKSTINLKEIADKTGITPKYHSICTLREGENGEGPKAKEIEVVGIEYPLDIIENNILTDGVINNLLKKNEDYFKKIILNENVECYLIINKTGLENMTVSVCREYKDYLENMNIKMKVIE